MGSFRRSRSELGRCRVTLTLVLVTTIASGAATSGAQDEAFRLDEPSRSFHAPPVEPGPAEEVAIGMVVVEGERSTTDRVQGARLAIEQARSKGRAIELVVGSSRGPWSTAAEVGRDLLFRRGCVALLSPESGEVTHLLAQIATKGGVPVLSFSAETELTRVPVPWLFRVVLDRRREIRTLVEAAGAGTETIGVLVPSGRPGRSIRRDLLAVASETGVELHPILEVGSREDLADLDRLPELVLVVGIDPAQEELTRLRDRSKKVLLANGGELPFERFGEGSAPVLGVAIALAEGDRFREAFRSRYDREPGTSAALAYQATSLLIDVVEAVGPDRSAVRNRLAAPSGNCSSSGFPGFDGLGERLGRIKVIELDGETLPLSSH